MGAKLPFFFHINIFQKIPPRSVPHVMSKEQIKQKQKTHKTFAQPGPQPNLVFCFCTLHYVHGEVRVLPF